MNLCDLIYETCDEGKILTAITMDQSAAFNCMSHKIFIEKLKLYNFRDQSIKWFSSYLSFRSQFVSIGCRESKMLPVEHSIPQGSVLGPIMYILYINELGEIPRSERNCMNEVHYNSNNLFNTDCKDCGTILSYADDTTYVSTSKSRETNQRNITENLYKIQLFLEANNLKINPTKMTLLEIMIHQKRSKARGHPPTLETQDELGNRKMIETVKEAIFLG